MPEKEGAEEKTTKSVVNKKQKQMMGEEGYDVARDEGRVKPSKDKKDGTTMTPSKEMEKTRKLVKGKSALERVKADIEKRYGKGAIMNVKKKEEKKEDTKEELDLTKVAESFGGYIVEKKKEIPRSVQRVRGAIKDVESTNPQLNLNISDTGTSNIPQSGNRQMKGRKPGSPNKPKSPYQQPEIQFDSGAKGTTPSGSPEMGGESKKFVKNRRTPLKNKNVSVSDKNLQRIRDAASGKTTDVQRDLETIADRTKSGSQPRPKTKVKGTATVTGDALPGTNRAPKKPRKLFPKAGPANTPAVRKIKKKIATDAAAKTVAKRKARNVVLKKVAKKAATKAAVGGTAKAGGKFLAKRIPGVGAAISGAEAMGRLATGDVTGALIAGAEGIASFVPGLGTAASAGLGAINLARDVRKATKAAKTVKKVLKYGRTAKGKVRTGKQSFQAFKKGRNIKKKMGPVKNMTTPDKALGTSQGNKIKDAIIGKTPLGRFVRGASTTTGLGGLISTGLGAAKAGGDAVGHVGRRSAGSM